MLTKRQKEMYYSYIYNHREFLWQDIQQLQQNLRYRRIDSIDCLEMALALERLNAFDDFVKTLNVILEIYEV